MSLLYPILENLGRRGLNVHGVAPPFGRAEELLPGCRSVVVVGSGGRSLWEGFEQALSEDSRRLTDEEHPLEAHIEGLVADADPRPDGRRWLFASDPRVPMQELAEAAGLGVRGRLWLVMHPEFGPWMALRAVCLTTEVLPFSTPVSESPCEGCSAPCAEVCPADALRAELDWKRCIAHQALKERCFPLCHSRRACPEGEGHAYTTLQQRYHAEPHTGRVALASKLGIAEDRAVPPGRFTRVLRAYLDELKESR